MGHPFLMKGLTTLVIPWVQILMFKYIMISRELWCGQYLWCDFKWAKNSSPNTNDLYIHYKTPPSLEEKKALSNCGNKEIHVLKNCLLQQFWGVWNDATHMYKSLVFGDEFLAHLKSHQRVQLLSADQSSSSTLTESSFKVTPEVFSCFLQTSQVLPHWLNHHLKSHQRCSAADQSSSSTLTESSFKVTPEVFSCFLQTSQVLPHWLNHHLKSHQRCSAADQSSSSTLTESSFKVTPEVFSCFLQTSQVLPHWLNHHLKSHQRCSAADQSSSSTLTESSFKSHQRCSAAFCRPVKFFHTDWIIISLWFLSYTQRHCHVRIEKSSVQTVATIRSTQFPRNHYMLKH